MAEFEDALKACGLARSEGVNPNSVTYRVADAFPDAATVAIDFNRLNVGDPVTYTITLTFKDLPEIELEFT